MAVQGALPLYMQISERLMRDIAAGRLKDGQRLPPEREMAKTLGIAIGTLRHALQDMSDKGVLTRIQGSGNYISAKTKPDSIYALFRLELHEGGGLPTASLISLERLQKPADLPPFGTSEQAFRIRRLRYLSGILVALEEIWLDGSYCERIDASDVSQSLYKFYRDRFQLTILRADDFISMGPVPSWRPAEFLHKKDDLLPFILRKSYTQHNTCPEVSRTWFDPALCHYVARLP